MSFYYIATPYSRYSAGIIPAFEEASRQAAILTSAGVPVFSPIAHSHPIAIHGQLDPLDHNIWLEADRTFMEAAKGIIVCHMDGWQESYGVQFEIEAFARMGKPIIHMEPGIVPEVVKPKRRKVIGLVGFATSGKDLAAAGLTESNEWTRPIGSADWVRIAFADGVREAALALNPTIGYVEGGAWIQNTVALLAYCGGDWNKAKEFPEIRTTLQRLGTEAGRNIHGQDCWVNIARRKIDALPAGVNVVLTDVRFANEADLIRQLGGQLIYISRPGVGQVNGHVSDAGLEALRAQADCEICNNGTPADLQAKLRAMVVGRWS